MSGIKCGPQSASSVCSWLYCLLTAFIDIFLRKWVKREKTTNNIIISCVGGSEDMANGIYGIDKVNSTKQIHRRKLCHGVDKLDKKLMTDTYCDANCVA